MRIDIIVATGLEARELATETGKRYSCSNCGSEFVVTRSGDGALNCCGRPMKKKS